MSKNVHSEEEWDILSDPEETPENMGENDTVINEPDDIKILIKECGEKKLDEDIEKIETMIDNIERETEMIEYETQRTIEKSIEKKNLIDDDLEMCMCLAPYVNQTFIKSINRKISDCTIL